MRQPTDHPNIHSFWLDAEGNSGAAGDPDTVFPWWSFSKTLIAICALRLVESGLITLNAALPGKPYSLGQLLQHRAGIPDYGSLGIYHEAVAKGQPAWSREQLFRSVDPNQLLFTPGSGWRYSNIGYLFIREQIEQLSGRSLNELVRSFVSAPAGLTRVRLATEKGDIAEHYDPGWVYHGCFVGPVKEAVIALNALQTGQLVNADSLAIMNDPHILGGALPGRPWSSHGYGLGLMAGTMSQAGPASGHSGSGPGSVNAVYHFGNLGQPVTVGSFSKTSDEGITENEAQRIAMLSQPR